MHNNKQQTKSLSLEFLTNTFVDLHRRNVEDHCIQILLWIFIEEMLKITVYKIDAYKHCACARLV